MSDPSIVPRVERAYKAVAFQTFNFIVALFVVNIALGGLFFIYNRMKGPRADKRVLSYREQFADR